MTVVGVLLWCLSFSSAPIVPLVPWPGKNSSLERVEPVGHVETASQVGTGNGSKIAKVAKVSMLYGAQNEYYERAIDSHIRHGQRHGYPVYVLTHDISRGYWNKPTYLLSIVIQELGKAPEERAQWLMYG